MNYSKQYIAELIEKFDGGQTTEKEEQILAEYFASATDIPSEWEVYRDMFASFGSDAYDFSEDEISAYLTTQVTISKSRSVWRWLTAACVAGIAGLLWCYMPTEEMEPEITISELCETMTMLSEVGYGQVSELSATPTENGFVIKAFLADGQSCSFSMQRNADGYSIKML